MRVPPGIATARRVSGWRVAPMMRAGRRRVWEATRGEIILDLEPIAVTPTAAPSP